MKHFTKLIFIAILFFGIFGLAKSSLAATYYVDYSGSDGAGTLSSPWKYCPGDARFVKNYTPDTVNGDTFIFKGGVGYTAEGNAGNVLLTIANSGGGLGKEMIYDGNSSGGWGTGKAKINLNATSFNAFAGFNKNYIKIINFDIDGAKNPRNSSNVAGIACPPGQLYIARFTSGLEVDQCVAYTSTSGSPGFIRVVAESNYWTIQNNKIHESENWQDNCITNAGPNNDPSVMGSDGLGSASATSLTISTGSKNLTTDANLPYVAGQTLSIYSHADSNNYMRGIVTSYTRATGALAVNVASVSGSGTYSKWDLWVNGNGGIPSEQYGIQIEGYSGHPRASHITIDSNEFYAVGRYTMTAYQVDYLTVTNNDVGGTNLDNAHKGWTASFIGVGNSDHALIQHNRVHDIYAYIAVNPAIETQSRCHAGDLMHWYTNSQTPITNAVIDGNSFNISDTPWTYRLNNSIIGQIQDVSGLQITNNVVTNIPTGWGGIYVFGQTGYYKSDHITIANNTLLQWGITNDSPDSIPLIDVCGTPGGGEDNCDLSTVNIQNNILVNYGSAGMGWPISVTGTGIPNIDYNIFWNPNNRSVSYLSLSNADTSTEMSLSAWKAYTQLHGNPQGIHTIFADPKLVNVPSTTMHIPGVSSSGDYSLQSLSPARGTGINLSSIFALDKNGNTRKSPPAAWDIGAYEYAGNNPPPTTYNISNFTSLVSDWLKNISNSPADVNTDGSVNAKDLGIMMSEWK